MSQSRTTEILEKMWRDTPANIAVDGHYQSEPHTIVGYNPSVATTEEDIWSAGGLYVWPITSAQWRMAAGNSADVGVVIKGNAEGAVQTIKCDALGDSTTLVDSDVNFLSSTAVAVGDLIMLDPKGTSPEFGYITDITDAATGTLIIGGGFSSRGSCNYARAYTIVDKSNGTGTGAQAVEIYYLTSDFTLKNID